MAEVKNKVITVESLKAKHDYDENTYLKKSGALGTLGITATAAELNYVDGVTSNVQTQLNGKQTTITGGATTITSNNLTASRALVSDGSGKVAVSAVTSTELGYLDGVTSNVQTQLNGKAASSHSHSYLPLSGGNVTGEVKFDNAKVLSWKNIDGTGRSLVQLTANNEYHFGYGGYLNNEGATYLNGNNVNLRSKNNVYFNVGDTGITFKPATGTYNGHFYPNTTSKTTLGLANNRWYCLYQYASAVNTSDEREKHDIKTIAESANVYEGLFDKLIPKTYRMNEGEEKTCIGFVAQDVARALDEVGISENDSGLISHDYWTDEKTGEQKDMYGLAYTEFIALNTYMIQKQQAKIEELEARIKELEKA
jgi:hypothetical protein